MKVPRVPPCTGFPETQEHGTTTWVSGRKSLSSRQMPLNFSPKMTGLLIFLSLSIFSSGIARSPFKHQRDDHGALLCLPKSLSNCRKGEKDSSNPRAASHNIYAAGGAFVLLSVEDAET